MRPGCYVGENRPKMCLTVCWVNSLALLLSRKFACVVGVGVVVVVVVLVVVVVVVENKNAKEAK